MPSHRVVEVPRVDLHGQQRQHLQQPLPSLGRPLLLHGFLAADVTSRLLPAALLLEGLAANVAVRVPGALQRRARRGAGSAVEVGRQDGQRDTARARSSDLLAEERHGDEDHQHLLQLPDHAHGERGCGPEKLDLHHDEAHRQGPAARRQPGRGEVQGLQVLPRGSLRQEALLLEELIQQLGQLQPHREGQDGGGAHRAEPVQRQHGAAGGGVLLAEGGVPLHELLQ
mmetsp:Transcript_31409/g.45195  ORF Transcript_31409/g.45195 Transcript_31409/m.45195 type:complete len:227 (-) Transcript_31409:11-691(-)